MPKVGDRLTVHGATLSPLLGHFEYPTFVRPALLKSKRRGS